MCKVKHTKASNAPLSDARLETPGSEISVQPARLSVVTPGRQPIARQAKLPTRGQRASDSVPGKGDI